MQLHIIVCNLQLLDFYMQNFKCLHTFYAIAYDFFMQLHKVDFPFNFMQISMDVCI